jgi:hypothetical protein
MNRGLCASAQMARNGCTAVTNSVGGSIGRTLLLSLRSASPGRLANHAWITAIPTQATVQNIWPG